LTLAAETNLATHPIVRLIDQAVEQTAAREREVRSHLGASLIGKNCERELFYTFRWAKQGQFEGRMLRLFARGAREEQAFVDYLKQAGIHIWDRDSDGQQFRVIDFDGHFGGSLDGLAQLVPTLDPNELVVVEFKTHNLKSFIELQQFKVKIAKPQHYGQMQIYMGKRGLRNALYLAVCKNDDKLHAEIVPFDLLDYEKLLAKAKRVIYARTAPPRIASSPAYYECKFCTFLRICHYGESPAKSCRSCRHSCASKDATWFCGKWADTIPEDVIPVGCDAYQAITD
jgi:hypothetical protein